MNPETRAYVDRLHTQQRDYAYNLTEAAHNGSIEARTLLPHATSAAEALYTLTICECAYYSERRFCTQQANKYTRRAANADEGTTIAMYNTLIASIFEDLAPRMGDIGEPLHVEEGEEEDEPLYAPEITPERVPVPA